MRAVKDLCPPEVDYGHIKLVAASMALGTAWHPPPSIYSWPTSEPEDGDDFDVEPSPDQPSLSLDHYLAAASQPSQRSAEPGQTLTRPCSMLSSNARFGCLQPLCSTVADFPMHDEGTQGSGMVLITYVQG